MELDPIIGLFLPNPIMSNNNDSLNQYGSELIQNHSKEISVFLNILYYPSKRIFEQNYLFRRKGINMIIYKDLFGGNDEMASDTYKIKVTYTNKTLF